MASFVPKTTTFVSILSFSIVSNNTTGLIMYILFALDYNARILVLYICIHNANNLDNSRSTSRTSTTLPDLYLQCVLLQMRGGYHSWQRMFSAKWILVVSGTAATNALLPPSTSFLIRKPKLQKKQIAKHLKTRVTNQSEKGQLMFLLFFIF